MLFNAGCKQQVFSPKPWKKFGADPSCRFWKKKTQKTHTLIPKNDVTDPKAKLL